MHMYYTDIKLRLIRCGCWFSWCELVESRRGLEFFHATLPQPHHTNIPRSAPVVDS